MDFFRVDNIGHAISYISEIFSLPEFSGMTKALTTKILITIFVLVEWIEREGQYAISHFGIKWRRPLKYAMYYAIVVAIFWFDGNEQ